MKKDVHLCDHVNKMAADLLAEISGILDGPVTFTAKDKDKGLQVIITLCDYTPMTLDAATFARIRDLKKWPQEVVSLPAANAAAS